MNFENNDPPFASFCRVLDAIISFCEGERRMQMIYGFWANCLEQLSAVGNIFITVTFRTIYRISYAVCRISFIVPLSMAETINRVWLIEYGKWNLVAVICILFITYSDFLTIWLHFVASCECIPSPLLTGVLLVYLGHFCMHTKLIWLHDDKFHTAPTFATSQKSFSRSPTTVNYGNSNNSKAKRRRENIN